LLEQEWKYLSQAVLLLGHGYLPWLAAIIGCAAGADC